MNLAIRVGWKLLACAAIGYLLPTFLPMDLAIILSLLQGAIWGFFIGIDITDSIENS